MIKRIRFATRAGTSRDFPEEWRAAVAGALAAPPGARPERVAACTVLRDLTPDAVHDGVGLEWFTGPAQLARFEAWLGSEDGATVGRLLGAAVDPAASPVVVASEHVMRGEAWLEKRWRDGGDTLKHMAIARRADGLTPAEFLDRWRNRAGSLGSVVIPDDVRGQAYAQNHPLPRDDDAEWAYDALNEVYFDEPAGLRARIAWLAEAMSGQGEADLVGESWFVAMRETLL